MAYKSFSKLSSRNQSGLVSQLHKLISYYGEIFTPRERVYLKKLTNQDGNIYWLENEDKDLVAAAIVDQNYTFTVGEVNIKTIGHTVSTRQGQMDRILNHIFTDNKLNTIILISRPAIASSIQHQTYGLIGLSPVDLLRLWPELANIQTDYFNISKETLVEGMNRRNNHIFLKIADNDFNKLQKSNPDLISYIKSQNPTE